MALSLIFEKQALNFKTSFFMHQIKRSFFLYPFRWFRYSLPFLNDSWNLSWFCSGTDDMKSKPMGFIGSIVGLFRNHATRTSFLFFVVIMLFVVSTFMHPYSTWYTLCIFNLPRVRGHKVMARKAPHSLLTREGVEHAQV